jgi:uncharacterized membrane protein YuzA (DUF378 family)
MGGRVADVSLIKRVLYSLIALAAIWSLSGIALAIYLKDARPLFIFWIWSLPFFTAGWVAVGLPMVAMSARVLKVPRVVLVIFGAIAGGLIMLLPPLIIWAFSGETEHFVFDRGYLLGWPAFGAAIGAGTTMLYAWLFSRAMRKT